MMCMIETPPLFSIETDTFFKMKSYALSSGLLSLSLLKELYISVSSNATLYTLTN